MTHYCLSTRRAGTKNGKKVFYPEPGDPSYLIAPDDASEFHPDHELSGPVARRAKNWAEQIIAEANTNPDPDGPPDGDIIFIVHGFNVNAKGALRSHKKISEGLKAFGKPSANARGIDKAVCVSYDWPAKGSFLNYLEDDSDARQSAIHLVRAGIALFARFTQPDCRIRVHVLAHSMGNLVVREAYRAAAGYPGTREAAWGVTQMIMYAADISSGSLRNDDGQQLISNSQRVTNYYNRHDKALATSNVKRFLSSPRLGRHGAPDEVLDQLVDVDCSERWLEVARTNDDGLLADIPYSHSFYEEDPIWLKDIAATLAGDKDRRVIETRETHPSYSRRMALKSK